MRSSPPAQAAGPRSANVREVGSGGSDTARPHGERPPGFGPTALRLVRRGRERLAAGGPLLTIADIPTNVASGVAADESGALGDVLHEPVQEKAPPPAHTSDKRYVGNYA
jgi:hypothetical protein